MNPRIKTTRLSLALVLFLIPVAALATESSAQMEWKAFLTKPSDSTYAPLSQSIHSCVAAGCHDADIAGSDNEFANLYKLLNLTEHGNHYAMLITFEIRSLYQNDAAEGEDIDRSLGLSSTLEPEFFLGQIRKYGVPDGTLDRLVLQTSTGSIDSLRAHREEWKARIQSLLKVKDPTLVQMRDKAISFIQHEIDKYSSLPDDAWGK